MPKLDKTTAELEVGKELQLTATVSPDNATSKTLKWTSSDETIATVDATGKVLDTNVIYPEVKKNPYSIYSFLLLAGYLRITSVYPQYDGNFMCEVGIPNKEIAFVYEKEILNKNNQSNAAIDIRQAIFLNDPKK